MADFHELLPEEADERDQRLVQDLRRMYRTDAQTVEHLARIRHRLAVNEDSPVHDRESGQQHYTPPAIQQVRSSTRNAKQTRFAVAGERSWQRRLSVLAAVLLTALLVGSLLLVLNLARGVNSCPNWTSKPGHWSFAPPWFSPACQRSCSFPTGYLPRSRFSSKQGWNVALEASESPTTFTCMLTCIRA